MLTTTIQTGKYYLCILQTEQGDTQLFAFTVQTDCPMVKEGYQRQLGQNHSALHLDCKEFKGKIVDYDYSKEYLDSSLLAKAFEEYEFTSLDKLDRVSFDGSSTELLEIPEETFVNLDSISDGVMIIRNGKVSFTGTLDYFSELDRFYTDEFNIEFAEVCEVCGNTKEYRMVDIDGTNLEEILICTNCK